MSTPNTPTAYPLYVKPNIFWGYNTYYLDPDDISSNIARSMNTQGITSPAQNPRQIGSVTSYTTPPTTLPPTPQNIPTLCVIYVEETTDPHTYIFYKKYKFLAVVTLDDPDKLFVDNILTPAYTDVSPIQSTTAVIFNAATTSANTYEQHRISLFDTTDRVNYRGDTNVRPLGYNAILKEDLLPSNQTVWNNYRFCKFSESDSSRATFVIDEKDLKVITMLFIADKQTNDVRVEILSDTDFTDVVASYLDDDTADALAVIKPLSNLAYTDKKILKSKTFYCYKGELING